MHNNFDLPFFNSTQLPPSQTESSPPSQRQRRQQTRPAMENGRALVALPGNIPPGLFQFRLHGTGETMLSIDSPSLYLDEEDIQSPWPNARDASGQLADQSATVQWFLQQYGRPEVTPHQIVDGLVARRFSTDALRSRAGYSAFYGGPTEPLDRSADTCNGLVRSILLNLSMYETGVLDRSVGRRIRIRVTNIFPETGQWATPRDFARIRASLAPTEQHSATSPVIACS